MTLAYLYKTFLNSPGVSTDTRSLLPGQVFFALKGENYDGNRFVEEALQKGAVLVVCDDKKWDGYKQVFIAESSLKVLQDLANLHRNHKGVTVLAITGSNGKTTTKELINRVISCRFPTLCTEGNLNNHIGVPLTLLRLTKEKVAVIEMGANHIGEIALLCNIAEPDIGIITNIGKAHLEGFGSAKGVKQAKGELYAYLSQAGKSILINMDDTVLTELARSFGLKGLEYGMMGGAITGTITSAKPFLQGSVEVNGEDYQVQTKLVGRYNFQNVLAAISAGVYFGIEPAAMMDAIAGYYPENNRSQVLEGASNTLILDAYNANPTSMKAALEDFVVETGKPKMVILGEMLELGAETEPEHRSLLNWLNDADIGEVLLVGGSFTGLKDGGKYPFHYFADILECMDYLERLKPSGFRILLKGSRKNALEKATNLLLDC